MARSTSRDVCFLIGVTFWLMTADRARGEEARPLPWVEGSTTVAVMPDTERYSDDYPHYFEAQTKWIAENHQNRNIACVLHLGDITQHNAPAEWEVARRCFNLLDGRVSYILATGNHDYDDNAPKRDTTRLTEYFPLEAIQKRPTFGGVHENGKLDNSFHLLRIGGRDWIVLALECGPRDEVVDWANKVLDQHADRLAIVVTHAYLFRDNTRYDHTAGKSQRASPHGWGNDGEQLWQKLVRRHPNTMIVLSGHVSTGGLGYLASEADYGNTVHQMMVDYEKMRGGGMAYMRLLEFLPDGKTVQVRTYSPALKSTKQSELEEFTFELKLADRETPKPRDNDRDPPLRMPVHRYSFDGSGGAGTKLVDSIGDADGLLSSESRRSALDGKGRLVLAGNEARDGYAELPAGMLSGAKEVSVEVWFTPTAESYNWNSVWRFGDGGGDFFWYTLRALTVHRAEISVAGDNHDIQRKGVPAAPGKRMHVVVTYDPDGSEGQPLLRCYRDGEFVGSLVTSKLLTDVDDTQNRLGPVAGVYDELRIYDYPLGPTAAKRSCAAGPAQLPATQPR